MPGLDNDEILAELTAVHMRDQRPGDGTRGRRSLCEIRPITWLRKAGIENMPETHGTVCQGPRTGFDQVTAVTIKL